MALQITSASMIVPDALACPVTPASDPPQCDTCSPQVMPPGTDNSSSPPAPTCSGSPIRYATGEIVFIASDISTGGFGIPWGHTRTFANRLGRSYNFGNGYNWLIAEWVSLIIQSGGTTIAVQGGSRGTLWFDLVGTAYVPRYSTRDTLLYDAVSDLYRLYDLQGGVTEFDGGTGGFSARHDAAGNTLRVISTTANGFNLAEVQRSTTVSGTTTVESFLYTYDNPSTASPSLTNITLRRQVNGGSWANVQQAAYTYYSDGSPFGAGGDLQTVTTSLWDNGAWAVTGTSYYRYDPIGTGSSSSSNSSRSSSSSSSSSGGATATHLLRYALNAAAYNRLASDPGVTNPLTASNAIVALYADYYY